MVTVQHFHERQFKRHTMVATRYWLVLHKYNYSGYNACFLHTWTNNWPPQILNLPWCLLHKWLPEMAARDHIHHCLGYQMNSADNSCKFHRYFCLVHDTVEMHKLDVVITISELLQSNSIEAYTNWRSVQWWHQKNQRNRNKVLI